MKRFLPVLAAVLLGAPAAPALADWTASGTFSYRDRLQDLGGFTGETELKPIRYARVEIVQSPNSVLSVGATDSLGNFVIPVIDNQTSTVFARVVSIDNVSGLAIRVQSTAIASNTYAVVGPPIAGHLPAADLDFGIIVAEPGAGGEAFNIYDVMVDGSEYARTLIGTYPPQTCTTIWSALSTSGTNYAAFTIRLLGEEGWDDAVIAHEHGHFIDVTFSKTSNPGGSHFLGDNNQDIRLAYGEGVASYHMAAGRKTNGRPHPHWYIDSTGGTGVGNLNFSYEIEGPNVSALGAASEVTVQSLLYDMIDDSFDDLAPCDDDGRTYPVAQLWNVMDNYLPSISVVSLEDFWDGWFSPGFDYGDLPGMKSVFAGFRVLFSEDRYEPDNLAAGATLIPPTGTPQSRSFYPAADIDLARFVSPGAGTQFVIETANLLSDANTTLSVLDHDGVSILATNNNRSGGDESSLILWTAPGAGDYYARVAHEPDQGVYGSYDLRVIEGPVSPLNFSEVGLAAGVGFAIPQRGAAWGDFDNDNDPDLFVTSTEGVNWQLFRNDGGTFVNVAAAAGVTGNGFTGEQCVWGDYDNDGDLDLYVATIGTNVLYRNNGNGTFVSAGAAAGVAWEGLGSLGASWADYNNDGHLDLFVATIGANDVLYENDGDGTFTDVSALAGIGGAGEDTFGGTWGDYDNDGDADLFVHNDTAANRLFRNEGDGSFTEVTPSFMREGSVRSWGATWHDYDHDADLDLYVTTLGSPCRLYRNKGNGQFTEVGAAAGVNAGGSQTGSTIADYDFDGDSDIYAASYEEANIYFDNLTGAAYYNSGKASLVRQSRSVSTADYNGDGDLDIFVVVGNSTNLLYANNGTANPWIRLKLVGTASNRAAIGATVTLRSAGKRHLQQVSGGTGYLSQDDQRLTFGLGNTAGPDTFEVRWPSGEVQTVTGLARNAVHTITESGGAEAKPDLFRPPPVFHLAQNSPNPFRGATTIAFQLPASGRVRLEILDVQGRLVRTLVDRVFGSGEYEETWDGGRDDGGRATAGIYFYRLTVPGGSATRKMVYR